MASISSSPHQSVIGIKESYQQLNWLHQKKVKWKDIKLYEWNTREPLTRPLLWLLVNIFETLE